MYSLIIQDNSLVTINVCMFVYAYLNRDNMCVWVHLCDIVHKEIGQWSYQFKCLFYCWWWLGVSDLFYISFEHSPYKMTIWTLVIPLIPGQSVKQKHYFRLGQDNLILLAKNGQEHDTKKWNPQFTWSDEMHQILFYWKCVSSHLISRDFKKSVKDNYELYVISSSVNGSK